MTLLTIAQELAKDVGMAIPDAVIGATPRGMKEVAAEANMVGEELARRVDWGQLTTSTTLTGDGTDKAHTLPAGFRRIVQGVGVSVGTPVRPLSQAEWNTLTGVEGVPRYFLLRDNALRFWPYLASAATATVTYQTGFWCSNGTAAFASDDDSSLIDEALFLKGLIARWRRQKSMPYEDQEAEYEAALRDFSGFNDRSRF